MGGSKHRAKYAISCFDGYVFVQCCSAGLRNEKNILYVLLSFSLELTWNDGIRSEGGHQRSRCFRCSGDQAREARLMEERRGRFMDGGKSACSGEEDAENKVRWRKMIKETSQGQQSSGRSLPLDESGPVGSVSITRDVLPVLQEEDLSSLRTRFPYHEATHSLSRLVLLVPS